MDNQNGQAESRKTILLADNSHTVRLVVKKNLQDNYEVIESKNGKEILELVEKLIPSDSHTTGEDENKKQGDLSQKKDNLSGSKGLLLVIISMELPDYNGFEVATQLRKKYSKKKLPIIINTSYNKHEDILKAMEVGINDYIVKPFPKELLLSKIHKLEREISEDNIKLSEEISKIPFFKGVPESQVAYALNTCSETIRKEKGEIICKQNEQNHDLSILMEGKCDVLFNNRKVSEIHAVDIIGEMGFLEEKGRSATVVATDLSKLIVFKKEPFENFLNDDRAISEIICKNVIHTLSERIKKSNGVYREINYPGL